uniref:Uncharacterized protein n=1 Tax=Arundo donax TaxID=35708 RepID=A0A0A9C8Q6_ARUDO
MPRVLKLSTRGRSLHKPGLPDFLPTKEGTEGYG